MSHDWHDVDAEIRSWASANHARWKAAEAARDQRLSDYAPVANPATGVAATTAATGAPSQCCCAAAATRKDADGPLNDDALAVPTCDANAPLGSGKRRPPYASPAPVLPQAAPLPSAAGDAPDQCGCGALTRWSAGLIASERRSCTHCGFFHDEPMRRAARTDRNQAEITAALRAEGYSVAVTSALGGGFPDLVVGWARGWSQPGTTLKHVRPPRCGNVLLELKDGAKPASAQKLTPDEADFQRKWLGPYYVVRSVEQALAVMARECGDA